MVAQGIFLKHLKRFLQNVHDDVLPGSVDAYDRSRGIPFPKKGSFFFLRMVLSIRRIIEYCFRSSLTSFSFVPEPLATRFILEELKILGFSFS